MDYIKRKYENRAKLCYTNTDSLIIYIITEDVFADISDDVERWFDTSNYDENDKRPLPIVIRLFKNELGGKIIKRFCALRAKTYSSLMDDYSEVKKSKGTKRCVIKHGLMFKNYKDCLFNGRVILKPQQRFKSDHHKVCTEEVNKIVLSSDDNRTPAVKVCENEMMLVRDFFVKKSIDCQFYGGIVL